MGNHAVLTIDTKESIYSNWYIPFQFLIPFESNDFDGGFEFKTTVKKAKEKFLSYGITVKKLEEKISEVIHVNESQLRKFRETGEDELYQEDEDSDSIEIRLELFGEDHSQVAETYKILQDLENSREEEEVKLDIQEIKNSYEEGEWYSDILDLFTDSENDYRNSLNIINLLDDFKDFDIFINHDYRDKEDFVKPLAEMLTSKGMKVWYDDFTLQVGDCLMDRIQEGLKKSRYGIVVLSRNFINNFSWAKDEFEGLRAKEKIQGKLLILPIWRNDITKNDVGDYNYALSLRIALLETEGIESIVDKIKYKISTT